MLCGLSILHPSWYRILSFFLDESYEILNWSAVTYGWVIVFGLLVNRDFWIFGVMAHLSLHNVCCTGQLLLAKGEVEQASSAFKIVLEADRDNVPALLGQVHWTVLFYQVIMVVVILQILDSLNNFMLVFFTNQELIN